MLINLCQCDDYNECLNEAKENVKFLACEESPGDVINYIVQDLCKNDWCNRYIRTGRDKYFIFWSNYHNCLEYLDVWAYPRGWNQVRIREFLHTEYNDNCCSCLNSSNMHRWRYYTGKFNETRITEFALKMYEECGSGFGYGSCDWTWDD